MWPVGLLLIAPFIGSFLGVVVRRLPRGESLIRPRSHCEACLRTLGLRELVPIVSFAALRGACASCGSPIARDHLYLELAATLVPLILLAVLPDATLAVALAGTLLGWTLLALAAIDARHWRLPDVLTLPLLVLGLGATWWLTPDLAFDHAVAASLGYGAFALLAFAYRRWRGVDGLGVGDAKLLAAAGAWVGSQGLAPVILAASLAGLAFAAIRFGRAVGRRSAIPFGPPLALATWVTWLAEWR